MQAESEHPPSSTASQPWKFCLEKTREPNWSRSTICTQGKQLADATTSRVLCSYILSDGVQEALEADEYLAATWLAICAFLETHPRSRGMTFQVDAPIDPDDGRVAFIALRLLVGTANSAPLSSDDQFLDALDTVDPRRGFGVL